MLLPRCFLPGRLLGRAKTAGELSLPKTNGQRSLLLHLLAAYEFLSRLHRLGCLVHDSAPVLFEVACSALYRHSAIPTPNTNQGPKLEQAESKELNSGDPAWNGGHGLGVLNFSPPR